MIIKYYAVFNYDEYDPTGKKYGISISFPDIPEAISSARTDEEAVEMALDVLQLCTIKRPNETLPPATPYRNIPLNVGERAVLITYDTKDVDLKKFTFFE